MSWAIVAIATSVASAGASIYGARKNADAIEAGSDQAAALQREALRTNLALSRPQLEVGTGALGILASLYGIAPPTPINFDNLGSGGGSDFRGGLANAENDPVVQSYRTVLGRDPDPGGYQYYSQLVAEKGIRLDELNAMHRTSQEYADKQAAGTLPPSELGGEFSQNYKGLRLAESPDASGGASGPAGAVPGPGLNLNELVANNPLIRFNREQGEQAIARGAAARGLNQSGGTLKDLTRFNQDLAGAGVQNFVLNPLFELAGFGPRAAAQMGGAAMNTGTNLGNLAMGAANARGSAYQNAGNTIGNLAGSVGDYAMFRNYMNNRPGGN